MHKHKQKQSRGKAARGWQEEKAGLKNTMRLQQLVQSHRPVPLFQFHCPLLCPVLSTSRGEKLPTLACLPQTERSCPPSRVCPNKQKLPTLPCLPQQAAHPPVSAPTSCPPSPVCPNKLPTLPCLPQQAAHLPVSAPTERSCPPSPICPSMLPILPCLP